MNKILEVIHGSQLYGLSTPQSDVDIFGIYLEDKDTIINDYFFNSEQKGREIDLSDKIKLENGKNSSDAVDKKFFSLKKYLGRSLNCNPNILELMYVTEENILFENDIAKELKTLRQDMLSKRAFYSFGSYAKKQAKKGETKASNLLRLENAEQLITSKTELRECMFYYEKTEWFKGIFEAETHHYKIKGTDFKIVKNTDCKRAINNIVKIIGSRGHRKKLIQDHGVDTKFMSHTLRLLYECEEILLDQYISFPIKGRDEVMAVKQGLVPVKDIKRMIELKTKDIETAFERSKLPLSPKTDRIYEFMRRVYSENI